MAGPTWFRGVAMLVVVVAVVTVVPRMTVAETDHEHTLTKRQTAEDYGPLPLTQRQADSGAPLPNTQLPAADTAGAQGQSQAAGSSSSSGSSSSGSSSSGGSSSSSGAGGQVGAGGGNGYFRTYVPQFGTGSSDGGVRSSRQRTSRTQYYDASSASRRQQQQQQSRRDSQPSSSGRQPNPSSGGTTLYSRQTQPVYDSQGRQVYNSQGQPVYATQGQGQAGTYVSVPRAAYSRGQPFYIDRGGESVPARGLQIRPYSTVTQTPGQPVYTGSQSQGQRRQVYTGGQGQPYYPAGSYPVTNNGQFTTYGQVPVYRAPQTVYTPAVQPGQNIYGYQPPYVNRQPYVPYNTYVGSTVPNDGCPETGVRLRINGMYCPQAIQHFGPFLCYRHEFSSRECCLSCARHKDTSKRGCEFGDHSFQCRQIQASDCYDIRNRQSCCETCERRKTNPDAPGCEYGDMTPRCDQVRQNPGLCYFAENQRLCCQTCQALRSSQNIDCPWGNQNNQLCEPYDNLGNQRLNCYAEPIRRLCCDTCKRLKARMPADVPSDCEYGNRPVLFNTPSYGSLNCSSFFRFFDRSQCLYNAAVSTNCCFTCYRMRKAGFLEGLDPPRRRLQTSLSQTQGGQAYSSRRTYSQVGTGRQAGGVQDRRQGAGSSQGYGQG